MHNCAQILSNSDMKPKRSDSSRARVKMLNADVALKYQCYQIDDFITIFQIYLQFLNHWSDAT